MLGVEIVDEVGVQLLVLVVGENEINTNLNSS